MSLLTLWVIGALARADGQATGPLQLQQLGEDNARAASRLHYPAGPPGPTPSAVDAAHRRDLIRQQESAQRALQERQRREMQLQQSRDPTATDWQRRAESARLLQQMRGEQARQLGGFRALPPGPAPMPSAPGLSRPSGGGPLGR